MRTAFIKTLCEVAAQDERIWLLCGDLGYSVLEGFAAQFPERFINVGVAEQNMTGVAAGLAMCGKIVFTYSIANFPVVRCLEQIRNDVCYHNQNVKIVAVGGGLSYGAQGYTHHGVEDLAMMQVLPNMTVVAPGDPIETRLATKAIASFDGPCYLRLGKAGEPVVHQSEPEFRIGKAIRLLNGNELTYISTGGMLDLTMQAAREMVKLGYSTEVLSMPTVSPLDTEAIIESARITGRIITVEEHGIGGLGTYLAEVLVGRTVKFQPLRLRREASSLAGSQSLLRSNHSLSLADIVQAGVAIASSGRAAQLAAREA